jgi:hypothetical protein
MIINGYDLRLKIEIFADSREDLISILELTLDDMRSDKVAVSTGGGCIGQYVLSVDELKTCEYCGIRHWPGENTECEY